MAQPSNTFSTYDSVGNREDLSDIIFDISPTETPGMTMAKKTKATATNHEWQTDALAAASATNAVIEGDDATTDASAATTRLGNYTQIQDKVARTTGTEDTVKKAGRGNELDYQVMKRSKELKRDMEASLFANNAKVAGNDTTARELAGIPAWLATNTSAGTSGSDPTGDGTDARTDGTQRAFTEDLLLDVMQSCWENGGEPDVLIVGPFNKRKASGFTGVATKFKDVDDKKIIASADVYVSDFGEINIVPNRFSRARDAILLQKDMFKAAMLRPMASWDLAKTGDSERKQILVEWTLQMCNEAAHGIVADLTTS
ncbi:MAG TPA: head protein [Hyphomonas sp.]|jgi:hypothetical protein|uniref:DUF5309 domain-containing protein n=1 Tax=Hyphomonas sp. TaxID=87 RepID=UPI000E910868|nr:DUF5309 domain-containing protein [Hyphomonas sp.]QDP49084.1 MAG: putative major capsid protein [Prokaryotic dsDNA virus sp.]HBN92246.1 head protein [Hyphomonas sp.]|tara:strand:+ start:15972 stop:16916 length:945 start_codon:yes stop_codon:yes gene_type:complete